MTRNKFGKIICSSTSQSLDIGIQVGVLIVVETFADDVVHDVL